MASSIYQLVVLGNDSRFHGGVLNMLKQRMSELGISLELLDLLDRSNFNFKYKGKNPVVVLYYGGVNEIDLDILVKLQNDANLILPIYSAAIGFKDEIPELLHRINGIPLDNESEIGALVNCILEGFSLLRLTRRLFISYRRNESSGVAIQLFEALERAGFDVFLDTHSIRKGDVFQEELWHRLVDTDVVVLLNTPDFLGSDWTKEELAKANSMSVGILQLIWPKGAIERFAELSVSHNLVPEDFKDDDYSATGVFHGNTLQTIIGKVEGLRARSLAARQDNLITECVKSGNALGKKISLQPGRILVVNDKEGKEIVMIPTIGAPHAFAYYQSEEIIKFIRENPVDRICLLFDHRNLREKWLHHMEWLDKHLPVTSVRIIDIDTWLMNNAI
ncbi:toll/interleukin-1 receptor domain-containing protein [Chitinophaga lutea]